METNYKTTLVLSALILALGISLVGTHLKSGILSFKDSQRVVMVKGAAEIEVTADKVIWPIAFKLAGNSVEKLYTNLSTTENTIRDFLKKYDISDADISTARPEVTDMEMEQYRPDGGFQYRYFINSSVTVNTKEVEKVLKAMEGVSELLKKGIAVKSEEWGRDAVSFSYNGLNDVKPTLIQEATANARASAEKFAQDSGSELGKIKSARQGEVIISTPDATTPYKKRVRVVTSVEYFLND